MAPRKQAQVAEPEPEEVEETEQDLTQYATKDITFTMEGFADWLIEFVYEGELPKDMDEETFRRGVYLGGSRRMEFQRSEWWKEVRAEHKAEQAEARAAKAAEKEAASEEAPAPKRGKAATNVTSTSSTAKPSRRGAAAAAAAPAPAAKTRTRRGTTAAAAPAEAPF